MKTGIELIADERKRQTEVEGWTPSHDDEHNCGELARAAMSYVLSHVNPLLVASWWPWDWKWYKPGTGGYADKVRNLTKAGALLAAEIDRLQRLETPTLPTPQRRPSIGPRPAEVTLAEWREGGDKP